MSSSFEVFACGAAQDRARTVGELERELNEAHRREAATAEVLRVIGRSPAKVQPVFDTIAANALALCGGSFSIVLSFDGEMMELASLHNLSDLKGIEALRQAFPRRPSRGGATDHAILSRAIAYIPDVQKDHEYQHHGLAQASGYRSILSVPILHNGNPVGAITVAGASPEAFSERQANLLTIFADQAAIAIENARLFEEIQDKSRELEIANTYKSRFLAAASHDLRQPLHALNLFVAQLPELTESGERAKVLSRIDDAVSAMNELFEALLDMSKLEAGILSPNLTEFPVERLLTRLQTTFAESAREKRIRLGVMPSSAWICSDFILLERILLNLVSNAVRYTTRGGIVVGCRRRGQLVRIDVWDSGEGIPEDQRRNIFAEFYQLGISESDQRGGLGLGLSIVDRLAHLLGHPIELTSRPGKGSRFSVLVPIAKAGAETTAASTPAVIDSDRTKGKLVVVMDDDDLVLYAMRGILSSWGCLVVTAASDKAALAQLSNESRLPDLIISDYRLADGYSGLAAIKSLRDALGAAIPAFLVSGDTGPERLREVAASGHQLLHKPVPPMALRTMLNRLLKAPNPSC